MLGRHSYHRNMHGALGGRGGDATKANVLGFHTSIQAPIVLREPEASRSGISERFARWLEAFRGEFLRRLREIRRGIEGAQGGRLAVGFFCKSGRHRSVACATLFKDLLLRGLVRGVRYDGTHHQASFAWFPATCGYCDLCRFQGTLREDLNDAVAACWAGQS